MLIEIYGNVCPKCEMTVRMMEGTVKRLGIDAEVRFIKSFKEMDAKGVKKTPAVFINGKKISEGGVPNRMLAEGWINRARSEGDE